MTMPLSAMICMQGRVSNRYFGHCPVGHNCVLPRLGMASGQRPTCPLIEGRYDGATGNLTPVTILSSS